MGLGQIPAMKSLTVPDKKSAAPLAKQDTTIWYGTYGSYDSKSSENGMFKLHLSLDFAAYPKVKPLITIILEKATRAGTIAGFKFLNETYYSDKVAGCEDWIRNQSSQSHAKEIDQVQTSLIPYYRHCNLPFAIYLHNDSNPTHLLDVGKMCSEIHNLLCKLNIEAGNAKWFCPKSDLPLPSKYFIFRQDRLTPHTEYVYAFDEDNLKISAFAKNSRIYTEINHYMRISLTLDEKQPVISNPNQSLPIVTLPTGLQTSIVTEENATATLYRLYILIQIADENILLNAIKDISALLNLAVLNGDIKGFIAHDIGYYKHAFDAAEEKLKAFYNQPGQPTTSENELQLLAKVRELKRKMLIPFEIVLTDEFNKNNFNALMELLQKIWALLPKQFNLDASKDLCIGDRIIPNTPFAFRRPCNEDSTYVMPFAPENRHVNEIAISKLYFRFIAYKCANTFHMLSKNSVSTFQPAPAAISGVTALSNTAAASAVPPAKY